MCETTPRAPVIAAVRDGQTVELAPADLVGQVVSLMLRNGVQVCGVFVDALVRLNDPGGRLVYRIPGAMADSEVSLSAVAFVYAGPTHRVHIGEHAHMHYSDTLRVAAPSHLET